MKLTVSVVVVVGPNLNCICFSKTAVMILFRFISYSNCMNSLHICTFTIISFTLVLFFFSLLLCFFLKEVLYSLLPTKKFLWLIRKHLIICIHCYYTSLLFQMIIFTNTRPCRVSENKNKSHQKMCIERNFRCFFF